MKIGHFYLGTHVPNWIGQISAPLFISRRQLYKRKTFPRATGPWALDSGGYTELSKYGNWSIDTAQYVRECRRFYEEIGCLEWIASMDWMCEPWVLEQTGLTILEHQVRTIDNFIDLRMKDDTLPWTPVLQGQSIPDYLSHAAMYYRRGIELHQHIPVGLGSVCRRQHTEQIEVLIRQLQPLRLHGFGYKIKGLERVADVLYSADSMAWSKAARYAPPLPGCTHKNCANCMKYALIWRRKVLHAIRRGRTGHGYRQNNLFRIWERRA